MKKSCLKVSILASLLMAFGCADDNQGDHQGTPMAGDPCTASVCKDANALLYCMNGAYVDVACDYGCSSNAGVSACNLPSQQPSCVADACLDATTLARCVNGSTVQEVCAYGCSNGACNPSASTGCVASVCQDNNTLLACIDGVQSSVACPYGCEKGACLQACTANTCLNDSTLLKCNDGRTESVACEYGCEKGACLEACTTEFCRDANTLMTCVDGRAQAVACPYGCNAGHCNTENTPTEQCTEDACGNEMTLYKCVNGLIQAQFCEYGCSNGACNDIQCTEDLCANDTTLNVCVNGMVQAIPCPYGCADNKCKTNGSVPPVCTQDVCANVTTLNACVNGQVVAKACEYGCADNKCNDAPDIEECTSSVCASASVLNACINGKIVPQTCDYGCSDNKCNSNTNPGNAGDSCVYGEYVESCQGEVVYYCGSSNTVQTLDCGEYASQGYSCQAFTMPDGSSYADCKTSDKICSSVGSENAYCEEYSYYGNVEFVDVCVRSETNNQNYWVTTDMAQCASATAAYGGNCNAEGTACADPNEDPGPGTDPGDDKYYDCTTDTCTEEGDTCGQICLEYGYNNKAWCDDEYVYCSDPTGGGSTPDPDPGTDEYYDCSSEICTEDGDTCLEACNDAGYSTDKAWCDDYYVYCSDPNGGGSTPDPDPGTDEYYDCSSEICTEEGDTCLEACNDAGYSTDKAWCDDEYVYCSDPNGGGSTPDPDPGTGDYYDCSSEICTSAGDTCVKACNDAGYTTDKAWCDDEYVYCSDPTGGGSTPDPDPGTDEYYDCSSEICTEAGDTCLKACNDAGYSTDKAWCDDYYVYCSDPNGSSSGGGESGGESGEAGTKCEYGKYVEKCVGEVVHYCGSSNTVQTLNCGEYASQGYACKAFNMSDGSTYADCLTSSQICSSVGSENAYCEPYSYYGNVEFVDVCVKSSTDNKNYWITTDMAQCATETAAYGGECNAAGTACAL